MSGLNASVPPEIRARIEQRASSLALLVRAGSKAYGIDIETSDDDYLGVFVARLRDFLSIEGIPSESIDGHDPDFTLHEIGKFCALGLKGNPAILETLWNPDVVIQDAWGRELISLRARFLHRGSLDVYASYAEAQLRKMVRGGSLHAKGSAYNAKYGTHLVRLLHCGLDLASTGEVRVRVGPELAKVLLQIRRGDLAESDVLAMAEPLLAALKRKTTSNDLPASADRDAIEDLVVRARLAAAGPR